MNTLYVPLDKVIKIAQDTNPVQVQGEDDYYYNEGKNELSKDIINSIKCLPTIDLSVIDTMIEEIEDSNLAGQYIVQKVNALQELKSRLSPKN